MSEFDAERNAEKIEERKLEAKRRSQSRDAAILHGRLLGEQTAKERGETGDDRDRRIRRAMAYAAWEYDGKPDGGAHLVEFDVVPAVLATRPVWETDFKKGK